MGMKYLSIDTETTGLLECAGASIIELGIVFDDLTKPLPINKLPYFHCYVKQEEYVGQPFALQMNAEILKKIATEEPPHFYLKPEEVGLALKQWLEAHSYSRKCDHAKSNSDNPPVLANAAGKNFAGFDLPFLKRLPNFHENVQFSQRVLDPAILYLDIKDFRAPDLKTCCERAKLNTTVVEHTAIADARMVVKLIRRHFKVAPIGVTNNEEEDI